MLTKSEMKYFGGVVAVTAGALLLILIALTYAGVVAPWSGRFYSLWDTGYAKIHIPIIASVSEHQPTTWFSFFFDLHILVTTFPVGLWYCIKHINDERVFGKQVRPKVFFSFLKYSQSRDRLFIDHQIL